MRAIKVYNKTIAAGLSIVALMFMIFSFSNVLNDRSDDVVLVSLQNIIRSLFKLEQDNQRLIKLIVNDFSNKPSMEPYVLDQDLLNTTLNWQQTEIMKLLDNKKNGVFIECGAFDGQYLSNTLDLEMNHGWSGVLIEPNPHSYQRLLKRHRKAWSVEACLSASSYMSQVVLEQNHEMSKVIAAGEMKFGEGFVKVQCFPLFSILLALNMTKIDFFSLDIEGQELNVLKTIPWNKVNIKIFCIEFIHIEEGKLSLINFMEQKGYELHLDGSQVEVTNGQNVDLLFYHKQHLQKSTNYP